MGLRANFPALIAVAIAATLFWIGDGLTPIWWAMWLAPVPILLICPQVSARTAFVAAFLCWSLGSFNQWVYLRRVEAPFPITAMAIVAPALVFAAAVSAWRSRVRKGSPVQAALLFASIWVSYELATEKISPHSTFWNIAYTQMNCLPVIQIAALAGVAGISFLMFFAPATAVALSINRRAARTRSLAVLAMCAVALALWMNHRLHSMEPGPSVRVGLIASDSRPPQLSDAVGRAQLIARYATEALTLAAKGAKLIVIPEKVFVVDDVSAGEIDRTFAPLATNSRATVEVGIERRSASARWNEARVYRPGALSPILYEKHHMVPAFESNLKSGNSILVWNDSSGVWGTEICKDMDFPALSRQYGNRDVGLLVVPAWDFDTDRWLHSRMAVLRGVEDGFSIVRSAKNGSLTVTDDRGRVLAEAQSDEADFATVLTKVPVRHDTTLYSLWGDWFGWLNVALMLALLAGSRIAAATGLPAFFTTTRAGLPIATE